MLRLGLCCQFAEQPIRFRATTARALEPLSVRDRLSKLAEICRHNATSLLHALQFCASHEIGCFRILSPILPLKTHPKVGYSFTDLPDSDDILQQFLDCGRFAQANSIRTSFHPDQFVVLNSLQRKVIESSLRELEYQAEVAEWVGADVINIHAGGAFGDKEDALARFRRTLSRLSSRVRNRLTVENDDKLYTPKDLLPLCRKERIPLVYDVHHHRCNGDALTEEEATTQAISTWNREPLFHISSPIEGWKGPRTNRHHDYINLSDFPVFWQNLDLTVEVEAKAKELAIAKLKAGLEARKKRLLAN